jgi:hypothetical protein
VKPVGPVSDAGVPLSVVASEAELLSELEPSLDSLSLESATVGSVTDASVVGAVVLSEELVSSPSSAEPLSSPHAVDSNSAAPRCDHGVRPRARRAVIGSLIADKGQVCQPRRLETRSR